jgi:hypothetical protein
VVEKSWKARYRYRTGFGGEVERGRGQVDLKVGESLLFQNLALGDCLYSLDQLDPTPTDLQYKISRLRPKLNMDNVETEITRLVGGTALGDAAKEEVRRVLREYRARAADALSTDQQKAGPRIVVR